MDKKIMGVMLVFIMVCTVISVFSQVDAHENVTIVDTMGNKVEIPCPVERIAVLNPTASEIIVALGSEDRVVGIDQYTKWNDEFFLSLRDKPSIGLPPMPNYEKIIDLNPQVVIAFADPLFCYPNLEKRLEPAGIKVVRLNFHDPKTYRREVNLLGQMLGKEKRAKEFLNFSQSWVDTIEERVKDVPSEERVRIYYEWIVPYATYSEDAGPSHTTTMAGGASILSEEKVSYSPFSSHVAGFFLLTSPELIVEKNPQVIIKDLMRPSDIIGGRMAPKTIGYTSKPDIKQMAKERGKIINRSVFKEIDAVRNGDVYTFAPSPEFAMSPRWPVALGYMAKVFYPSKFKDLDPQAFHSEWLKKWYGLEYKGVYVYP